MGGGKNCADDARGRASCASIRIRVSFCAFCCAFAALVHAHSSTLQALDHALSHYFAFGGAWRASINCTADWNSIQTLTPPEQINRPRTHNTAQANDGHHGTAIPWWWGLWSWGRRKSRSSRKGRSGGRHQHKRWHGRRRAGAYGLVVAIIMDQHPPLPQEHLQHLQQQQQ